MYNIKFILIVLGLSISQFSKAQTLKIVPVYSGTVTTSTPNKVNFCSTGTTLDEATVVVLDVNGNEINTPNWGSMVVQVTNVRNIMPGGTSPFINSFSNAINFSSATTGSRNIRATITPNEFWGAVTVVLKSSPTGSVLSSVDIVAWPAYTADISSSNFSSSYRNVGSTCISGPNNLSVGINTFTFNANTSNLSTYWKTRVSATKVWSVASGNTNTATLNIPQTFPLNSGRVVSCAFDLVGQTCLANGLAAQKFIGERSPQIIGNATLCAGGILDIDCNSSSTNSVPPTVSDIQFRYKWFKNNVAIAGATNKTYTPTTTGSYYCAVSQFDVNTSLFPTLSWNLTATVVKSSNTFTVNTPSAMPTPSGTISGTAFDGGLINCQPINLTNTSTTLANVKQYELTLFEGLGNSRGSITSGPISNFTTIDLTTINGSYLKGSNTAGTYFIKLKVGNECGLNSTVFQSANFSNKVWSNSLFVNGTATGPGGLVAINPNAGRYTSTFNIVAANSTSNLAFSKITYDVSGPGVSLLNQILCNPCTTIPQININSIGNSGGGGVFANAGNTPNGSSYLLAIKGENNLCPVGTNTVATIFSFTLSASLYKTFDNQNFNNELISIYPNPAKEFINIEFNAKESTNCNLNLYNSTGQQVLKVADNIETKRGAEKIKVNLNNLPSGIYYYYGSIGTETIQGKIIKE